MERRPRRSRTPNIEKLLTGLIIVLAIAVAGLAWKSISLSRDKAGAPAPEIETTEAGADSPLRLVSTATVVSTGDILMHKPMITAYKQADGSYDFQQMFAYAKPYFEQADLAVGNLETTLGGPDCGTPYQGNPKFNCPDEIVDAARDAGFDVLLTANNHCGDTGAEGILRTVEQLRARGLEALGTRLGDGEPEYILREINGIKVGLLCYTYASGVSGDGRPSLNEGAFLSRGDIVSFYSNDDLEGLCTKVAGQLEAMKAAGAEATVVYMHWGPQEYQLSRNAVQQMIAQNLCNLGVDVIIGGHPHVVQPMALLESSTDPGHRTLCLFSMGNAVSNQRVEIQSIADACPTGHTEDAVLYYVTFGKYSDGSVRVESTDVIPCWVKATQGKSYELLPLDPDRREEWKELYGLSSDADLRRSYDRTMELVGPGLKDCRTWLAAQKAADYPAA